ncbi:MAG TPA: zinc-dependent alcohol dehydrogenase family protein [Bryobacteraceae bacterium]|jgi:NADPH:quinone reductase-like Zn-dependent oxidoreductase|nr:zinc-dependent alcohol dehydrogenase family protein [Bryobacteraceae bacterium]
MPRTIRFHKLGGPENLVLEDVPSRPLEDTEVRLRVEAVGLNRAESLFYRGLYFEQPVLPSRIGYEAAGTVISVAPEVDPSWIGKKVATIPGFSQSANGVLGEEAVVPASSLAQYPANLSSVEAAAIWMQYLTAYGALILYGKVTRGDFVIITAASSSVGLAAIQLVKGEGATAIATTRTSKKRDDLLVLGADYVIATEEEDLPKRVAEITGGKGARIIFDPVAGPYLETLAAAAAIGGTIFEYGGLSMLPTPFPLMHALPKGLSIRGYSLTELRGDPAVLKTATRYIYDRLADGRLKPKIAKTFPLAESAAAYQYLESNEQIGKVVITV